MKKLSTNFLKNITAIFFGICIALVASHVMAVARPTSVTTQGIVVLHTGGNQTKDGSISVNTFMAGDYASTTNENVAVIDIVGRMAVGKKTTTTGIALDVKGTTGILGTIRSSALAFSGSGLRPLCTSDKGVIILCGTTEFTVTKTTNPDTKTSTYTYFVIPPGVTSMQVEMFAGGGAGWTESNGAKTSDDGDSSYVKGNGIDLTVWGGTGAVNHTTSVGGKGGQLVNNSSSGKVTINTNKSGEDGTGATLASGGIPNQEGPTKRCSGVDYYPMRGGPGTYGGLGGKAGPYGGKASGGASGIAGYMGSSEYQNPSTTWSFKGTTDYTSDGYMSGNYDGARVLDRLGKAGANGVLGGGGGGGGSAGGVSALSDTSDCSGLSGSDNCKGSSLYGTGGGAGGYVKATLTVTPGEALYIKVGTGGVADPNACGGNNQQSCFSMPKTGGSGGDGYIKITY